MSKRHAVSTLLYNGGTYARALRTCTPAPECREKCRSGWPWASFWHCATILQLTRWCNVYVQCPLIPMYSVVARDNSNQVTLIQDFVARPRDKNAAVLVLRPSGIKRSEKPYYCAPRRRIYSGVSYIAHGNDCVQWLYQRTPQTSVWFSQTGPALGWGGRSTIMVWSYIVSSTLRVLVLHRRGYSIHHCVRISSSAFFPVRRWEDVTHISQANLDCGATLMNIKNHKRQPKILLDHNLSPHATVSRSRDKKN